MKKFVKFIVAILVIAVIGASAVCLVGCDDSNVLYVVTNAEFPPFEYRNKKDKIVGFDIDYIKAIGAEIGMKVKIKHLDFASVIGEIQNKQNYVGIAGLTVNTARLEKINFTTTYFKSYQVYIVTDDDTTFDACTTAEEANAIAIEKKHKYVATGQVGQYFVEGNDDYAGLGGGVALPTINECIQKVVVNTSVAIADVTVAKEIVKNVKGYKIIDIPLTEEEYAIGTNKNNIELLDKINAAIAKLEAEGTVEALKLKWFVGK